MACDQKSNTPNKLVAVSSDINSAVNSLLLSNDFESKSEIINVVCPANSSIQAYAHTKCQVEIVSMPDEEVAAFIAEKIGTANSIKKIVDETRGEYDFFFDRDRWQMLSRELGQK